MTWCSRLQRNYCEPCYNWQSFSVTQFLLLQVYCPSPSKNHWVRIIPCNIFKLRPACAFLKVLTQFVTTANFFIFLADSNHKLLLSHKYHKPCAVREMCEISMRKLYILVVTVLPDRCIPWQSEYRVSVCVVQLLRTCLSLLQDTTTTRWGAKIQC